MKLIAFVLGLIIGGYAVHLYDQREYGGAGYAGDSGSVHDQVSEKIQRWHLTPEDIRADLAKTGQVVRENGREASSRLDDAYIATVIKGKYVLDKDLKAFDIHVESHNGFVTLTGTVPSEALVGKAVVLALDTGGVRNVTAKLTAR